MGRHAADRTVPGTPDPGDRIKFAGRRRPRHADLFAPTPGGAAALAGLERAARAFDRVIEPHRAALRAYILRLTDGDDAVADSVLKETLYRVAQEPGRYSGRPSALRPWLALTARNVVRDGERYAPAGHDDRPSSPAPDGAAVPIPNTTVVAAMEDLPIEHRELIVELFYDGASLETAASERGVPVETIKSRLYFAMHALRAVLDQHVAERHGSR